MSFVKIEIKEEIEDQDTENRIEMFLVDQEDNIQENELELNDPLEDTENCVEKKKVKKKILSIEERCSILERLEAKNKLENCKGDLEKGTEEKQFEKDLYAWFEQQNSEELPVTGSILKKQAIIFYKQHSGDDNFTASSEWLHNFKKRHGIISDNLKEKISADQTVSERIQDVESIKEKKASLSIQERCSILERLEAGERPFKLAKEFNVSKAAISQIKTRKEYILEAKKVLENCKGDVNKKRYQGTEDKQFEKELYAWVEQRLSKGLPIIGPILQNQARIINQQLGGKNNFTASDGWLEKFKKRHGIIVDNFREKVSTDPVECKDQNDENCAKIEEEKKRVLSIEERCNILERLEAGESSVKLAKEFDVSTSAIYKIRSRKKHIMDAKKVLENCKGDINKKRYRGTEDKQFEKDLYVWVEQRHSKGLPLTGPLLQKQAMIFYKQHGGKNNFTATTGWLHNFKKRHGITLENYNEEKKTCLSIQERCIILERLEAGELLVKLAKEFNVSKSAIYQIKNRKKSIIEAKKVLENCKGNIGRKRYRGTEDRQFEKDLYEWSEQRRSKGLPITGPILKKQAMILCEEHGGKDNFMASDGWLQKFKKRHGITIDNFREKVSADPTASEEECRDRLQDAENCFKNKEEKKISLSIEERCNIIKRLEAGESSVKLAKEFDVSKSAIYKIKSRKKHIMDAKKVLENCKGDINKKKYRGTEEKQFEKQLYEWSEQRHSEGLPLTGPLLQKQAMIFYKQHGGEDNFTASSGWLHNFKKRHGIKFSSVQEETVSTDESVDTVNWLRIEDIGWNETVLLNKNIVVEEMDDEDFAEVKTVSSSEALHAMKTYISWYQRHGDGDQAKLLMLQELEDFAVSKILEEKNRR